MTEQTQPTDAELEALAVEHEAFGFGRADKQGLSTHGFDPDGLRAFARAVLVKWGTPAGAGEPVGEVESSLRFTGGFHVRLYRDAHMPEPGTTLYTTPQPTQAQAGVCKDHDALIRQMLEALEKSNLEWKRLADSGDAGSWKAEDGKYYQQSEAAITDARIYLSKLGHAHHKQGEPDGKAG